MNTLNFSAGAIYPHSVVTQEGTTYFLARFHKNGGTAIVRRGRFCTFVWLHSADEFGPGFNDFITPRTKEITGPLQLHSPR